MGVKDDILKQTQEKDDMNELQVHELFRQIMNIGNKFDFSLKPFRIVRKLTTDELQDLLSSWEYKRFKRSCPSLAKGIEEYFESRRETKLRNNSEETKND